MVEPVSPLVFVPAAGRGSRLGANGLPKPLQSVGNLPLIGRIMDLYKSPSRFLIALGYQKARVRPVVELLAQQRGHAVSFIETDSFHPGTLGLTQTLLDARELLQEPFIFHAVDSIISQQALHDFTTGVNKVFFAPSPRPGVHFRTIRDGRWTRSDDLDVLSSGVYIGVAHVGDSDSFWKTFSESQHEAEAGEVLGIDPAITTTVLLGKSEWLDAGSPQGLEEARTLFKNEDVVLPREDEAIWRSGDLMIKYHSDPEFIDQRVKRGKSLSPFVPEPVKYSSNTYVYRRAQGITLSECSSDVFAGFLQHCARFWHGEDSPTLQAGKVFEASYLNFYRDKTMERVAMFLGLYPDFKLVSRINGVEVAPIEFLLSSVNWRELATIQSGRAHGDLHPENVVFDAATGSFAFLDWRQNLAGETHQFGDVYYDLAKIRHGLIVDHGFIRENRFSVIREPDSLSFSHEIPSKKVEWDSLFTAFLSQSGYEESRVNLLTALIFLNIAPLHHHPYDNFLFALGHEMLSLCLSSAE